MSYLTIPRFSGSPRARSALRNLLATATLSSLGKPVRALVEGDSQETCPGGLGVEFCHLLNWYAWRIYGNMPETQIAQITNSNARATGGAFVGGRSATAGSGTTGATPTARFPYNLEPAVGSAFNNSLGYQQTFCHQNYDRPASLTEILDTVEYVTRAGASVNVLVPHIATQPPTLRLHYRHHSGSATGITQPNYSNNVAGVTLSAGITDDVSIAVTQTNANAWTVITRPFNWQATGPNSGNITTLGGSTTIGSVSATRVEIGPVWYTSANTRGITFHSISAGGRRAQDFLIDRPDCAPMLRALQPDIVMVTYGANDSEQNFTAQQFYDATLAKIKWWQANVSPDLVFVLASDPDRTITSNRAQWDLYPEMLAKIADDPLNNAVHINRRRVLQETDNWIFSHAPAFNSRLSDGVHYSVSGARAAALQTWVGMLNVAGVSSLSFLDEPSLTGGPALTTGAGPLVSDSPPIQPRYVRSGKTHRLRVSQVVNDASQFRVFARVGGREIPVDIVRSGLVETTITVPSAQEYFVRRLTESASPSQYAAIWLIHQEPT